jgi:pimeloyl-ACP methyl ester carboxylesterase
MLVLAGVALVGSVLGLGLDGLIIFGVHLAFSADPDEPGRNRSVAFTQRNLAVAAIMGTLFVWFYRGHLDLTETTRTAIAGALVALPLALDQSTSEAANRRTIALTTRSLILATWALVVFIELYHANGKWLDASIALCVILPICLAATRVMGARRGRIEFGLLRHPFRRDLRAHLAQALNIWVCCALIAGILAAGAVHSARNLYSLTGSGFTVLAAACAAGLVVLAALALVPRRRVYIATNVVVALLSGFLLLQLTRLSATPADAVVLDSPLEGEWFVTGAGNSVLVNGHSPNEIHGIDFRKLGPNGLTHTGGDMARLEDYDGFGASVLAPADGRIVEVIDNNADTPPGINGDQSNIVMLDIGDGRFVVLGHLQQGSAIVRVGDVVQSGDPLAAVGNSGHTNEPHLHLQVQDSRAISDADRTYPIAFRNVQITRGGPWPWSDDRIVRTGDTIQQPEPSTGPPERVISDLYEVDGETAHLNCQGDGSPTVVFLGGMGFTTTTWDRIRADLGPHVRTCAWDYPGTGRSTGTPMMTTQRAAASLAGTLQAANIPTPVVLVGHSIGGMTAHLYVAEHPDDVAGVVLLDPTVAAFARTFDAEEFRPRWDGTASADQADQVTAWPDIPLEILRHDPGVYASQQIWSAEVEARWGAEQEALAELTPDGTVRIVPDSGHNIHEHAPAQTIDAIRRVLNATT